MKDDRLISLNAAIDALDKVAEMFPYRIPGNAKTYRQYNEAWSDAIDAAENAFEALPPAQPSVSKEEMVGDTISRQAAIKAICEDGTMLERQGKYTMTMAERKQRDVDILDSLPSAQPSVSKTETVEDCISRQAAIKTAHLPVIDDAGYEVVRVDDIMALPSAQPELSPCDVCRYYPPSSMVGKPCTICPAERRTDG